MTNIDGGGNASGAKRERSPSFPYIGLGKAVERTREFATNARRSEVRIGDAASAWGMAPKSSSTLQTAAALLAFGLIEDNGSGDARKIKVTDLGRRILEDERPGARVEALAEAALKPKLIAEYAELWKEGRPADSFCISELKLDRGFTEEAAERFLRTFDDTIQFASAGKSDKVPDKAASDHSLDDRGQDPPPKFPQVENYCQWTSNGVLQFAQPRKVVAIFPDGKHAQVFGSNTGIPMNELKTVDAPAPPLPGLTPPPVSHGTAWGQEENEYNVLQKGNRLQITADVDLEGIGQLKEMLADYKSILKRLTKKSK